MARLSCLPFWFIFLKLELNCIKTAHFSSCIKTAIERGSKFLSYEIELRNRVTQHDVTLRVTNSEIFIEILPSSY